MYNKYSILMVLFQIPLQLLSAASAVIPATTMSLWIVPGEPTMKVEITFVMNISPGTAGTGFSTME